MKICLRPLVSWGFTNNNHQAVNEIICLMIIVCKTSWNQRLQTNFHGIKYINLMYIYLSFLYISSITDIEHSPNYIALDSPKWISDNQHCYNICIYIYIRVCVYTVIEYEKKETTGDR